MRLMMALPHDWRCIPTSLANKIPVASICRGCSRCAKTCATAVTTSPIDSPFDRRGHSAVTQSSEGSAAGGWPVDADRRADQLGKLSQAVAPFFPLGNHL